MTEQFNQPIEITTETDIQQTKRVFEIVKAAMKEAHPHVQPAGQEVSFYPPGEEVELPKGSNGEAA